MLVGLVLAVLAVATPAPIPPPPARWVEDASGFLSSDARGRLDARLEAAEHATGHQVVVWIGESLGGAPLDDWAVRTFAAWKVGRKGLDDGLVIFVLSKDRTIDIEVGYGLEDKVPDAIASRIIRETMAPLLVAGDRDGAVTRGVDAVLAAVGGGSASDPVADGEAPATGPSPFELIVGGIAILALLILAVTHPRLALFFLWTVASAGRGGDNGRGGFSGGGGTSGGGGARGKW